MLAAAILKFADSLGPRARALAGYACRPTPKGD